jgi:hypothetical protein
MITQQMTDQPDDGKDNFDAPMPGSGSAEGDFGGDTKGASPYTRLVELHPNRKRAAIALAAVGAAALVRRLAR